MDVILNEVEDRPMVLRAEEGMELVSAPGDGADSLSIHELVERRLREKQKNKEFKDTTVRIGGSKKERAAYHIITRDNLGQLEEDAINANKLVVKERVYPEVDIEEERAAGVSAGAVFLKIKVREAVAAAPPNTVKARELYVDFIDTLRNVLSVCKTVNEIREYLSSVFRHPAPETFGMFDLRRARELNPKNAEDHEDARLYNDLKITLRSWLEQVHAHIRNPSGEGYAVRGFRNDYMDGYKAIVGSRFINLVTNDGAAKELILAARMYEPFTAEQQEIRRLQTNASIDATIKWLESEKQTWIEASEIKLREEKKFNSKFYKYAGITTLDGVRDHRVNSVIKKIEDLRKKFDTLPDVDKERAESWDWIGIKKERAASGPRAEIQINTYPPLPYLLRKGGLQVEEYAIVDQDSIAATFGYKAVEFGNWVKDSEARQHVRFFTGAMLDLAEALNFDIVSVNHLGGLSIGFGSRGKGRALAHYEASRKFINVTKKKGDGSIAHEWGHYFDNVSYEKDVNSAEPVFYSQVVFDGTNRINPLQHAFYSIMDYIKHGSKITKSAPLTVTISDLNPKTTLRSTLIKSSLADTIDYFHRHYRHYFNKGSKKHKDLRPLIASILKHFNETEVVVQVDYMSSEYYFHSKNIGSPYWIDPEELFARAFETYVYDKLEAKALFNNYLVGGSYFGQSWYPQGQERKDLFALYDNLITVFKEEFEIGDFFNFGISARVDEKVEYTEAEDDTENDDKDGKGVDVEMPDPEKAEIMKTEFSSKSDLIKNITEGQDIYIKNHLRPEGSRLTKVLKKYSYFFTVDYNGKESWILDSSQVSKYNFEFEGSMVRLIDKKRNTVVYTLYFAGDMLKPKVAEATEADQKPLTPESARSHAIGLLTGSLVDRIEGKGYEFVPGDLKAGSDLFYELVGAITGSKADRLLGSGITIQKKASVPETAPETVPVNAGSDSDGPDTDEWRKLRKDIRGSLITIYGIDNGREPGYDRNLFMSSIKGKIERAHKNGKQELVDAALDYVRRWTIEKKFTKPVFTDAHSIWKLHSTSKAKGSEKPAGHRGLTGPEKWTSEFVPLEDSSVIHLIKNHTPVGPDRLVASLIKNGKISDVDFERVQGNPNYNTLEKMSAGIDEDIKKWEKRAYANRNDGHEDLFKDSLAHDFLVEKAKEVKAEIKDRFAPAVPKADDIHGKTWEYGMRVRPFGIGTYPEDGFVRFEEDSRYKFGVLHYSRPLTLAEIKNYEVVPVTVIEELDGRSASLLNNTVLGTLRVDKNDKGGIVSVTVQVPGSVPLSYTAGSTLERIADGRLVLQDAAAAADAPRFAQKMYMGRKQTPVDFIGTNADGNPIYEDERGVRSLLLTMDSSDSQYFDTEPVSMTRTQNGVGISTDGRGNEYKLPSEITEVVPAGEPAPSLIGRDEIPPLLMQLIPPHQLSAILGYPEFREPMLGLAKMVRQIPSAEQAAKTEVQDRILWLHYAYAATDIWIVGLDSDITEQREAYGYSILNGDHREGTWGTVNIQELKWTGKVELDVFWEPVLFPVLEKQLRGEPISSEEEHGLVFYTDAPKAYDMGETMDLGETGEAVKGRMLRKVSIRPDAIKNQTLRYNSGNFAIIDSMQYNDADFRQSFVDKPPVVADSFHYGAKQNVPLEYSNALKEVLASAGVTILYETAKELQIEMFGVQIALNDVGFELEVVRMDTGEAVTNIPYFGSDYLAKTGQKMAEALLALFVKLEKEKEYEPIPQKKQEEIIEQPASSGNNTDDMNIEQPEVFDSRVSQMDNFLYKGFNVKRNYRSETQGTWEAWNDGVKVGSFDMENRTPVSRNDKRKNIHVLTDHEIMDQIDSMIYDEGENDLKAIFEGSPIRKSLTADVAPASASNSSYMERYKGQKPAAINTAIRQLIMTKGDSRGAYSADELQFIALYEGSGGTKEDVDNTSNLDQFFTPQYIVDIMWGLALKHGFAFTPGVAVSEPTVGTGRFLRMIPNDGTVYVRAYEVEQFAFTVCKLLYPEFDIRHGSFEAQFFQGRRHVGLAGVDRFYDLVIGNPPYKDYMSKYGPLGERQATGATRFEHYFIMRGIDILKQGGLLVMIIPNTFLSNNDKYNKLKEVLSSKADLIDAYRLPNGAFDNTDVGTDIVVFRKK